jgi:orotate phosphoribosyltransferase
MSFDYNSENKMIMKWLFETNAIKVADPESPFWYTSGTLGPYYINTHFLYGDQDSAESLLKLIEAAAADPLNMPGILVEEIMKQYNSNDIFHRLMDLIIEKLEEEKFDLISGGERRDFFFSIPAAVLMNKPHLTILKDMRTLFSSDNFQQTVWAKDTDLSGLRSIHIADLVTEASSYIRAWIPAIRSLNMKIDKTLAVVDRCQGGSAILAEQGIDLVTLTSINAELFDQAVNAGLMSLKQQEMVLEFADDPHAYMDNFFKSHPDFLSQQIVAGGKSAERARLCIEQGYGCK